MPEYDDLNGLFGESEGEDNESSEIDPGTVAFLDQQSAEFNARAEQEFADRYGFVHNCRCDQDYTEGNLVQVTECYAGMTLEALDACALLNAENKVLRAIITSAISQNIGEVNGEADTGIHPGGADIPGDGETPEGLETN